ncbi:ATP synthase subunit I [Vibrio sp. FNV 38]|nr:ATP synthase subunit I [Vibrio sp. FNV 38]
MLVSNRSAQGRAAYRVVHLQLIFVILIASIAYVKFGQDSARFVLKGGLIAVFANYIYALFAFLPKPDSDGSVLLGFIFIGWTLKLVFTMVMFVLVFSVSDLLQPGAFFTGYKLTILIFWLSPILFFQKNGINHG